jgi:hypothetical protein
MNGQFWLDMENLALSSVLMKNVDIKFIEQSI